MSYLIIQAVRQKVMLQIYNNGLAVSIQESYKTCFASWNQVKYRYVTLEEN